MKKLFLACAIGMSVLAFATTRNQTATTGASVKQLQDTIPGKKDTSKMPWPDTTRKPTPPVN